MRPPLYYLRLIKTYRPQLLCRFRPPLPGTRTVSISSTSIKATIPATENDAKSVVIDGLVELARMGFVREGKVRLVLRGLEGQDATVRVAVLGRSGSEGRLLAALLADPLSTEKGWVDDLLEWSTSLRERRGALLIRHGPPSPIITPSGSPISLLSVPSNLLKSSIEIILAPPSASPSDLTLLTLQVTETPGARVIEYPVHKTLFWAGEGSSGLSTLLSQPYTSDAPILKVVSLPGHTTPAGSEGATIIADLATAEAATTQLQSSVENANNFQHLWRTSNLGAIQRWVLAGTTKSTGSEVKPVVKDLISSIIAEAEVSLDREAANIVIAKNARPSTLSPTADDFQSLSEAWEAWSQSAHSELREGLEAGFKSKAWKGLAWWKLLWAVDDVAGNARDVIAASFLVASKKSLIFLAGRFSGAGYRGGGKDGLADYPPHLSHTTNSIITTIIPHLQGSANRLLLRAFSLSTTAAALSALLYLSEISVYSSASVVALGVVYSARTLQSKWEGEKQGFQAVVAEQGREAVVEVERWGWERLVEGVEGVKEEGGVEGGVEGGRRILEQVRRALERV